MTRFPCFANCGNPMCIKGGCQRAAFDNAWETSTIPDGIGLISKRKLRKQKKIETTTVCSRMTNCHRRAKITGDPARPPFCNRCKRKNKHNRGIKRKSRAERRKIKVGS